MNVKKPVVDRRVQKTQRLLHEALIALIREKDYDAIGVGEILDRANVGRSTFYSHFHDKDELLASGISHMLGTIGASHHPRAGRRDPFTWFSLPIFEHHERHRNVSGATVKAGGRAVVHEHLRRLIVGSIRDELGGRHDTRSTTADQLPPELLAEHVASTFILVLNWWLDAESVLSATAVDGLFRSLIRPAVS
jgi:AcrR family transcriptional regulator